VQVRTAIDRRAIAARDMVLVTKPQDVELEKAGVMRADGRCLACQPPWLGKREARIHDFGGNDWRDLITREAKQ
jgi:hypothetical protein